MKGFRTAAILFLAALALSAAAAPAALASHGGGTRIALRPTGAFPAAKGSAKLQTRDERELEVEVEHVRRLAGRSVVVFVGGRRLGAARVNALGHAELTRRGARAPRVVPGTAVVVRTAAGTRIVAGRF